MVNSLVGGVAADDVDLVGDGGGAGAVDHPHRLPAPKQGIEGGEADRAGAEDDVTGRAGHDVAHDRGVGASSAGRRAVAHGQQRVQQQTGQGGEGGGTAGAEDGELLLGGNPGQGGDDPAERPQERHGQRPPPASSGPSR